MSSHHPRFRSARLTPFTSRGASLVEIMVAMSVVAVSALAAGSFFSQQMATTRNMTRNSSCKAALDSQLGYIREMTAIAPGYEWKGKSTGENGKTMTPAGAVTGDSWVDDSVRMGKVKSTDIIAGTGAVRELNTHLLQKGSVGFLASLYNGVPGIQSGVDFASIPHKGSEPLPAAIDQENLKDFKTEIAIKTINVGTGEEQSFGSQTWARPQGQNPDAALAGNGIGTFPTSTSERLGYRVALKGTFTDGTGATKSCEASEDFFYPIDLQSPKLSVVLNAFDASTDSASIEPFEYTMLPGQIRNRQECSHTPAVRSQAFVRMEVGFKTSVPKHEAIDSGTIFLCRDVSRQLSPNYCEGAVNAAMRGNEYNTLKNPITPPWVPCNEVTACGIKPVSVNFVKDGPGEVRYVLNYNNSTSSTPDGLWGCDIAMDVATVDAAGNFQVLATQKSALNPKIAATQGRYFQPAPCYACYKKKPFSFLTFALIVGGGILTGGAVAVAAAVGAAVGGLAACATGVGGACKMKGYNFKGNKCAIPSGYQLNTGKKMCRKITPAYPDWYTAGNLGKPTSGKKCPAQVVNYPNGKGSFTLPASLSGAMVTDEKYDLPNSSSCSITAECKNGAWVNEDGAYGALATCNTLVTAMQIDSNFQNDQKVCVLEVPNGSKAVLINKGYYSKFNQTCTSLDGSPRKCVQYYPQKNKTVCSGAECLDNNGGKVCRGKDLKYYHYCHGYPVDALDPNVKAAGPNYFYFTNFDPKADVNLSFCDDGSDPG